MNGMEWNGIQFLTKFGKIVCWRPPWELAPPPRGNSESATVIFGVTPTWEILDWPQIPVKAESRASDLAETVVVKYSLTQFELTAINYALRTDHCRHLCINYILKTLYVCIVTLATKGAVLEILFCLIHPIHTTRR